MKIGIIKTVKGNMKKTTDDTIEVMKNAVMFSVDYDGMTITIGGTEGKSAYFKMTVAEAKKLMTAFVEGVFDSIDHIHDYMAEEIHAVESARYE